MSDPGQLGGFVARLRERLESARNGLALMVVRCAAVERIDTTQGLVATDELRGAVEQALRKGMLRPSDLFEWTSRDECIMVLEPCPSEGIAILAAQKAVRLLSGALAFGDRAVIPEAAAGIALGAQCEDAETLLRQAKLALQAARVSRERWAFYRNELAAGLLDLSRYQARLRRAIAHNLLALHFQPQIDTRSGRLVGAEALLRWHDEELGHVPPALAVAAAEASGLIHELTRWVVTGAVRACAAFQRADAKFEVSLNVSPSNLHQGELADHLELAARTWGLGGSSLTVEVTETAMLGDQKAAMAALHELKKHRVGVSIDDFGTGYSSMFWLAQMPLDELKIDMVFVRGMLELPQNAKIVRSLIELAHNLELRVVAEGVETEAVSSALTHLGCDRLQGYFIGKPMPADELAARLRAQ